MPVTLLMEFESGAPTQPVSTSVCGKALGDARCKINQTAQRLNVAPPCDFFAPDDAWIEPEVGLHTLRTVLAHLRSDEAHVCSADRSLHDLTAMERVLARAESRFRLRFVQRRAT